MVGSVGRGAPNILEKQIDPSKYQADLGHDGLFCSLLFFIDHERDEYCIVILVFFQTIWYVRATHVFTIK